MNRISWWKIGLTFILLLLFLIVSALLSNFLWFSNHTILSTLLVSAVNLSIFYFLSRWFAKLFWKESLRTFYLSFSKKNLWPWVIVGTNMVLYAYLIYLQIGYVQIIRQTPTSVSHTISVVLQTVLLSAFVPAYTEELFFRGFLFRLLQEKLPLIWAMVLPSLVFGLLHLIGTKNVTIEEMVLLVVAGISMGIIFCCAVYITKSLYSSIILHTIWNGCISGGILKLSASTPNNPPFFQFKITTSNILFTGGTLGTDVSTICIGIYILFDIILLIYLHKMPQTQLSS